MTPIQNLVRGIAKDFPQEVQLQEYPSLLEANFRAPDSPFVNVTFRMPKANGPTVLWISDLRINELRDTQKKVFSAILAYAVLPRKAQALLDKAWKFPELQIHHVNTEYDIYHFEVFEASEGVALFEFRRLDVRIDRKKGTWNERTQCTVQALLEWSAQSLISESQGFLVQ